MELLQITKGATVLLKSLKLGAIFNPKSINKRKPEANTKRNIKEKTEFRTEECRQNLQIVV